MGNPLSSVIANIVMEKIEQLAIRTSPHPIWFWGRYVDDVFAIVENYSESNILKHINSLDKNIQFTHECEAECKLPFLDLCITREPSGYLSTTVYRKPTNTTQHLPFSSCHPTVQKIGVIRTFAARLNTHCSTAEAKEAEAKKLDHRARRTSKRIISYPLHTCRMTVRNFERLARHICS